MLPPRRVTIRCEMASPTPLPGTPRACASRDRRNMSKTVAWSASVIPTPSSSTTSSTRPSSDRKRDADLSVGEAELHGVVDDVDVDPGQGVAVRRDHQRLRDVDHQTHPASLGLDLGVPAGLAHQGHRVDLVPLVAVEPLLGPGQGQQVVDQAREPLGAAADRGDRVGPRLGQPAVGLEQLGVQGDRGQRGLEVVGERGDQVAAVLVELPQLVDEVLVAAPVLELLHDRAQPPAQAGQGVALVPAPRLVRRASQHQQRTTGAGAAPDGGQQRPFLAREPGDPAQQRALLVGQRGVAAPARVDHRLDQRADVRTQVPGHLRRGTTRPRRARRRPAPRTSRPRRRASCRRAAPTPTPAGRGCRPGRRLSRAATGPCPSTGGAPRAGGAGAARRARGAPGRRTARRGRRPRGRAGRRRPDRSCPGPPPGHRRGCAAARAARSRRWRRRPRRRRGRDAWWRAAALVGRRRPGSARGRYAASDAPSGHPGRACRRRPPPRASRRRRRG